MPKKLRKPRTSPTPAGLRDRLWRTFLEEEALRLEAIEAGDHDRATKHTNAMVGLAPQIRSAHETEDQEARLKRVESAVGTHIRKVG